MHEEKVNSNELFYIGSIPRDRVEKYVKDGAIKAKQETHISQKYEKTNYG
jgi:hypothetical protein